MTPFTSVRSIKSAVGLPPHIFLASRRIEQAKALLLTTTFPAAESAWRIGYESVSHFTQMFRTLTGTRRGQFRGN